jgi:uncharacterized protein (DUF2236 family)
LHHVRAAGSGLRPATHGSIGDPVSDRIVAERPGRGSLTWRCAADTRGLLLAPPTLILQVAHPVVGAGVTEYSNFTDEPWSRLVRTIASINRVVFGSPATAVAESRRLRRLHASIRGIDSAGRPYHALDPDAYAWVHLTLVHFFVEVQRVFGPPLTPGEREVLYLEWRQVGRLLGVHEDRMPADWAGFRLYFDDMVEHTLETNRAVDDVLTSVACPKRPVSILPAAAWQPLAGKAGDLSLLFAVGNLPKVLRERIGLPWTRRDQERLQRQTRRLRLALSVVPRPLLTLPPAMPYLIRARVGGRRPSAALS